MEVTEGARHSLTANIPYSSLTVDHSLSITHLKPKIVYVFDFRFIWIEQFSILDAGFMFWFDMLWFCYLGMDYRFV